MPPRRCRCPRTRRIRRARLIPVRPSAPPSTAGLADQLRQLATEHGTTRFAVLLAAYSVVLARLTGSDDLLIAVPMAARVKRETESVIGLFMNTVVIRVQVDRDGTLGDLLRSVHAATARAMEYQDLPFARVVELVKPDRDPARLPLVQVMFAMEESWAVTDRGGLRWRPEIVENGTAKFEIGLTVTDAPAGPHVRINYNAALFESATARAAGREPARGARSDGGYAGGQNQ